MPTTSSTLTSTNLLVRSSSVRVAREGGWTGRERVKLFDCAPPEGEVSGVDEDGMIKVREADVVSLVVALSEAQASIQMMEGARVDATETVMEPERPGPRAMVPREGREEASIVTLAEWERARERPGRVSGERTMVVSMTSETRREVSGVEEGVVGGGERVVEVVEWRWRVEGGRGVGGVRRRGMMGGVGIPCGSIESVEIDDTSIPSPMSRQVVRLLLRLGEGEVTV